MSYAKALRCRKCGQEYPLEPRNMCDVCLGRIDVTYDYEAMKKTVSKDNLCAQPVSMWRYRDLLPVDSKEVDIGTGYTPLTKADNLGKELGLKNLYVKNDCLNPTYSFKDRAVSVAVTKALEFGFDTVACASTGNLAASVAAHAAKANLKSYVFIPSNLGSGKMVGAAIHKPNLVTVNGSYDDVNRLCINLSQKYNWGFININLRPYYAEGSKTLGHEIGEQLGWQAPDCVIAPAGSGLMFTRIWKGLNELAILGLIDPVKTRMYVSQAAGSSPIVNAYNNDSKHINPVTPDTIAKSIAIGNPSDGEYAVKIAKESGGGAWAVSDKEALTGIKLLAQTEGIFAEATGGVVIAVLKKLVAAGKIKPDDLTVAVITGAGPRTQDIMADVVHATLVEPTVESFDSAFDK
ncbi:MAG: threonine synthase [Chloroflexi bacterium]|jgi:threonine synthase|nr:threonine synthase [Chloroflexota bacterium]MBT7081534.1 threonine synthase [Chloroflexota bacterium]MBT7289355.1 threonine synthase [Chloroflexota bacterium]